VTHGPYVNRRELDPFTVQQPRRWRGEIPDMAKLFLPKPDPYQRRRYDGPPWENEVEWAKKLAEPWAREWFETTEVAAWLDAWPGTEPRIAAGFKRAGISPKVAMTPLWYGKVNPGRPPLAVRVAMSDVTLDDAIAQLRSAGLAAA